MGSNPTFSVYAKALLETLYMTFVSFVIAYVIALVLGILLIVSKKGGIAASPILNTILGTIINILRAVPFILLLIFIIPFTRLIVGTAIGTTAMIVPLTIASAPFVARLVENALSEVDSGLIEAAKSMGASTMQIVVKVYIRESIPSLVLAGAVAFVSILGYTAMAGTVSGGGLGQLAYLEGWQRYKDVVVTVSIILLVVITQGIQWLGRVVGKMLNKKR